MLMRSPEVPVKSFKMPFLMTACFGGFALTTVWMAVVLVSMLLGQGTYTWNGETVSRYLLLRYIGAPLVLLSASGGLIVYAMWREKP